MYEVKRKVILNDAAFEMDVYAPLVAKKCEPGQFIIARVGEDGERIPLTIGDYDVALNKETIKWTESVYGAANGQDMEVPDM